MAQFSYQLLYVTQAMILKCHRCHRKHTVRGQECFYPLLKNGMIWTTSSWLFISDVFIFIFTLTGMTSYCSLKALSLKVLQLAISFFFFLNQCQMNCDGGVYNKWCNEQDKHIGSDFSFSFKRHLADLWQSSSHTP